MKKFWLILASMALTLSMAACGGEEEVTDTPAPVVEEEVTEEEVVEADDEAMPELDLTPYEELAPLMYSCYIGYNEDAPDEFAALSFDEDVTMAILVISNAEESVSFVGDVTIDGSYISILDYESNVELTMDLTDNEDGTYSLDMGDLGSLLVVDATTEEMMYLLALVDSATEMIGTEELVEPTDEAAPEASTEGSSNTELEQFDVDITPYQALEPLMATNFVGTSNDESGTFGGLSYSADGTMGIFILANADESMAFIGDVTMDGSYISILDDESGSEVTVELIDNGDGSYTIDIGDFGTLLTIEGSATEMMYLMAIVDKGTELVN